MDLRQMNSGSSVSAVFGFWTGQASLDPSFVTIIIYRGVSVRDIDETGSRGNRPIGQAPRGGRIWDD